MTPGRSSAEKRLWPVPMWCPRPSPGSGSCWGWRRLYSRPKSSWPSSPQNNATGSPPRSPLLRREQEQQPSLVQHARVRQQGEDAQDVRPQDIEPRAFSQVGQSQGDFKESRSDQARIAATSRTPDRLLIRRQDLVLNCQSLTWSSLTSTDSGSSSR